LSDNLSRKGFIVSLLSASAEPPNAHICRQMTMGCRSHSCGARHRPHYERALRAGSGGRRTWGSRRSIARRHAAREDHGRGTQRTLRPAGRQTSAPCALSHAAEVITCIGNTLGHLYTDDDLNPHKP